MTSDISPDLHALSDQAFTALRAKNVAESLVLFERLCAQAEATAGMHLGHAYAQLAAKNIDAMMLALDQVLARDPSNTRALILKGDGLLSKGDARAAPAFYAAALRSAPQNPPPVLARDLARAQAMVTQAANAYEDFLRARLAQAGYAPGRSSPRFTQALDMLTGRADRIVTQQRPRMFYLPGLQEHGFHPQTDVPWMPALEAQTAAIRTELEAILETHQGFAPYIQPDSRLAPGQQKQMEGNADWSAYYLWKSGTQIVEHTAQCPQTASALSAVPLCDMPLRGPMALFSWLKPGAHIPAHTGMLNTRLICHLPLIVPPGCEFRVGAQTRTWRDGEGWAFDDTFDHEAWNRSDRLRVILIFDVWRPDVTLEERHLINAMLSALDEHTGKPPQWEI